MNFLAYFFLLAKSIIYGLTPYFTTELSESYDVLDILALRFLLSLVAMWLLKTLKVIKIEVGVKNFIKKSTAYPISAIFFWRDSLSLCSICSLKPWAFR